MKVVGGNRLSWVYLPIALLFSSVSDAFLGATSYSSPVRQSNSQLAVVTQESASATFSGAGPVSTSVDMNVYNLASLEEIAEEWSCAAVPATPLAAEGVYLQPRNKQDNLADTIKVAFPRLPGQGLGLQLLELAGGRADGIGITIISGLTEGGSAEFSGILPGDSVIQIEVQKQSLQKDKGLNVEETEEMFAVQTECLGYDKTIESVLSLPEADESVQETFLLTLKRLRRKPKVTVKLQYPPEMEEPDITLELFSGENLRRALLVRGVKLNDKLATRFDSGGTGDCGAEGTCATCAVAIVKGQELLSPAKTQEAQIFAKHPRWRMTCKAVVGYGMTQGELTVRVSPRQWDRS